MKQKRVILIIGILVLVVVLAYFIFFYKQSCQDAVCFSNAMLDCDRVKYVDEDNEASWLYSIKGQLGDECIIRVELLQAKQGNVELEALQGIDMDCYLPLSYVGNPQQDLTRCHGLLKEELQEMMIQKMHGYILANLGEIDEALKGPL